MRLLVKVLDRPAGQRVAAKVTLVAAGGGAEKLEGVSRPRERNQFIGTMAKLPGWSAGKALHTRETLFSQNNKTRKMVVPDLNAIRKSPAGAARMDQRVIDPYWQTDGEDRTTWLTRCFFIFANAAGVS